jgi:sugar phosphate isomerase/epimerase
MKLGIMYPNPLAKSLADLAAMPQHGCICLQMRPEVLADAQLRLTPEGREALKSLNSCGVEIVGWCAYRPLIGPKETVAASVEHIKKVIQLAAAAREISSRASHALVASESGNPAPLLKQFDGAELWRQIVRATREITTCAEERGVLFAFEPTRSNILDSSKTTRKLIEEIGSKSLGVCFDPANTVGDKDTLEGAVDNLKQHIHLAHAKDVIIAADGKPTYPPAGKGSLDYRRVFQLLDPIPTCRHIVIEYVRTPQEATETIAFLKPFCE